MGLEWWDLKWDYNYDVWMGLYTYERDYKLSYKDV